MRKKICTIALSVSVVLLTMSFTKSEISTKHLEPISHTSDYCKGWAEGYKAGWCYEQGIGCIDPIVPICPIKRIGEEGYKDGYNRGFVQGKAAREDR